MKLGMRRFVDRDDTIVLSIKAKSKPERALQIAGIKANRGAIWVRCDGYLLFRKRKALNEVRESFIDKRNNRWFDICQRRRIVNHGAGRLFGHWKCAHQGIRGVAFHKRSSHGIPTQELRNFSLISGANCSRKRRLDIPIRQSGCCFHLLLWEQDLCTRVSE